MGTRRIPSRELSRLLGSWRLSEGSLQHQLARGIETAILRGRLPLGVRLPAERDLAHDLRLARGTVSAAYGRLRSDGLIVTRIGSGSVTALPAELRNRLAPWSVDVGEEGRDGAVLDLTRAEPAAPLDELLPAVRAAAQDLPAALMSDDLTNRGLPALRAGIATRYTEQGLPTQSRNILVVSGADSALHLLGAVLLRHGHRAVVDSPTYPGALNVLRAAGARTISQPLHPHGWDVAAFERLLDSSHAAMAYLIIDFHNPTGQMMAEQQRSLLRSRIGRHDALLVIDETMRDLDLRPTPVPVSRIAGVANSRQVLTVGSLSKTLWPGLRVGWIRAHHDIVARLSGSALASALAPPLLDQLTAVHLLNRIDAIISSRVSLLRAQRDHLADLLSGLPWVRFEIPDGGLSLWVELLDTDPGRLVTQAAAHRLRLSPGFQFSPDGLLDQYLRLPFTLPMVALDRVVERLVAAHAEAPARPARSAIVNRRLSQD